MPSPTKQSQISSEAGSSLLAELVMSARPLLRKDAPEIPRLPAEAKFLTCDCCERLITFAYFKEVPLKFFLKGKSEDGDKEGKEEGDEVPPPTEEVAAKKIGKGKRAGAEAAPTLGNYDICFPCYKRFKAQGSLIIKQFSETTGKKLKPQVLNASEVDLYYGGTVPKVSTSFVEQPGLKKKRGKKSGEDEEQEDGGVLEVDSEEMNPAPETLTWDMLKPSPFKREVIVPPPLTTVDPPPASVTAPKERKAPTVVAKKPRGRPSTKSKEKEDKKPEERGDEPVQRAKRKRTSSVGEKGDMIGKPGDKKEKDAAPSKGRAPRAKSAAKAKEKEKDEGQPDKPKRAPRGRKPAPKTKSSVKTLEDEEEEEPDATPARSTRKVESCVESFLLKLSMGAKLSTRPPPKEGDWKSIKCFVPRLTPDGEEATTEVGWGRSCSVPWNYSASLSTSGTITAPPKSEVLVAKAALATNSKLLSAQRVPTFNPGLRGSWFSSVQKDSNDSFLLLDIWGPTDFLPQAPTVCRFSVSCGKEQIISTQWLPVVVPATWERLNYLGVVSFLRKSSLHMAAIMKDPRVAPRAEFPNNSGLSEASATHQVWSTDICCNFRLQQIYNVMGLEAATAITEDLQPKDFKWSVRAPQGASDPEILAAISFSQDIFILRAVVVQPPSQPPPAGGPPPSTSSLLNLEVARRINSGSCIKGTIRTAWYPHQDDSILFYSLSEDKKEGKAAPQWSVNSVKLSSEVAADQPHSLVDGEVMEGKEIGVEHLFYDSSAPASCSPSADDQQQPQHYQQQLLATSPLGQLVCIPTTAAGDRKPYLKAGPSSDSIDYLGPVSQGLSFNRKGAEHYYLVADGLSTSSGSGTTPSLIRFTVSGSTSSTTKTEEDASAVANKPEEDISSRPHLVHGIYQAEEANVGHFMLLPRIKPLLLEEGANNASSAANTMVRKEAAPPKGVSVNPAFSSGLMKTSMVEQPRRDTILSKEENSPIIEEEGNSIMFVNQDKGVFVVIDLGSADY